MFYSIDISGYLDHYFGKYPKISMFGSDNKSLQIFELSKFDNIVKSQKMPFSVIPAKAGIQ